MPLIHLLVILLVRSTIVLHVLAIALDVLTLVYVIETVLHMIMLVHVLATVLHM